MMAEEGALVIKWQNIDDISTQWEAEIDIAEKSKNII